MKIRMMKSESETFTINLGEHDMDEIVLFVDGFPAINKVLGVKGETAYLIANEILGAE